MLNVDLQQHEPEGFYRDHKPVGVAIVSDIDDGKAAAYNLPSPSAAGALPASREVKDNDGKAVASRGVDKEDYESWVARTGWAPRFGNGDPKDDEGPSLLDHETWLEGKLEDKLFGGNIHPYYLMSQLTLFFQIGITIQQ